MDEDLLGSQTRRGQASDRILQSLALEFPNLHSRASLMKSQALRSKYGRDEDGLDEREVRAASKTLGRLIADGAVAEVLVLSGLSAKVLLPFAGLIAVSVDLVSLRSSWVLWGNRAAGAQDPIAAEFSGPGLADMQPSQEQIIGEITHRSQKWIADSVTDGNVPLALNNISIVHGTGDFDILISAAYKDPQQFNLFAREVIQRIPHVARTHTMQIARNFGYPGVVGFDSVGQLAARSAEDGAAVPP
jgi:hypothetical protein